MLLAFAVVARADKSASYQIDLPGLPFAVTASKDQQWIFVSLIRGDKGPGLAILQNKDGKIGVARVVPMSAAPTGMVLSHAGDTLIVTADDSVVLFDTGRLENGRSDPAFQWVNTGPDASSIYANLTADDKTLFVSDERAQRITVIDLEKVHSAARDGSVDLKHFPPSGGGSSAIVGRIPVGRAPIALTFSKDQKWLFTTSQVAPESWGWPDVLAPEGGRDGKVPEGAVIVIDVAKAKSHPEDSVVGRAPSGGSPVRLALSPDGERLFVSARNSDAVMVFETKDLTNNPAHARPVKISVGKSPVPIVVVADGKFVLVGNSDRFNPDAAKSSTLSVLDTSLIGTEENPKIGSIPCGTFPREFHLTGDGKTLLLTNFRSRTLQVIEVSRLREILVK